MTKYFSLLLVALALFGCGDDGEPTCLGALPESCVSPISAGYDSLYRSIIQPRCGVTAGGTTCHNAAGHQGGLDLSTPDIAYQALLASRVKPNDPACSLLMQRIESEDPNFRMPRGAVKLTDGERCAIQQWIAEGAER